MVRVHIWYNSDCSALKFRHLTKYCHLTSHIRNQSLHNKYLTHFIHTVTKETSSTEIHLLILTNLDLQLKVVDQLLNVLNTICQVTELKENCHFICIDLLSGKSRIIKQIKKQLAENFSTKLAVKDLGRHLRVGDFVSRARLTLSASRKIELKISKIIREILKHNLI